MITESSATKEYESVGELIDLSDEEFRIFLANKNLGYICGLENILSAIFNQTSDIKNDLVERIKYLRKKRDRNKHLATLKSLYPKLELCEQKIFICREIKKERYKHTK